ncbi:MAG: I78 family peptidase inhibitor [Hyphomonadaceae bacterium]
MRVMLMTAALLVLAACGQTTASPATETPTAEAPAPQTREEATAQDTCGASQYRSLVGQQIAAVTVPEGVRTIMPDTMVTQDFRADRVNILVDAQGVITSVECY